MSKSGQYALEQQIKAYERGEIDINDLRPDEVEELEEWYDDINQQERDDDGKR